MAEKKETKAQKNPICLVIMPFSDPKGYEPGHFRKIYNHILAPAIEAAGFVPHRIDENAESTMIHAKLLDQLINAPMVLCDLSSKNPNVLYELGIRHAFDKPVVLVQEKGQDRIFDISGLTTVEYRKDRFYDEVLEDQKTITEAIVQNTGENKYSIMSLVQLHPANMNEHQSVTQEDRMMFTLEALARQISRLEEQINRKQSPPAATTDLERRKAETEIQVMNAIDGAHSLIQAYSTEKKISSRQLSKAGYQLKKALDDYQRMGFKNEPMVEFANLLLDELRIIDREQSLPTG